MIILDKNNYKYNDEGFYEFYFTENSDPLLVENDIVQDIVNWYVYPNGFTASEVQGKISRKYSVDLDIRKILKALEITKNDAPLAPHLHLMPLKERNAQLLEISKRNEEAKTELSKLRKELDNQRISYEELLKELKNRAFDWTYAPIENSSPIRDVHIAVTDWHIGCKTNTRGNTFNLGVAEERVHSMAKKIREQIGPTQGKFYWYWLGDMVESPLLNMKPDHVHNVDERRGHKQIVTAAQLIATNLMMPCMDLASEHVVISQGGNHGRFLPHNTEDPLRTADMLVYEFAEQLLGKQNIDFRKTDDYISTVKSYNTLIYATHGDRAKVKDCLGLLWPYRKDAESFVVLSGHKHHHYVQEIHKDVMFVQSGSLVSSTQFSSYNLAVGSNPSQAYFFVEEDGPYGFGNIVL